MLIAFHAPRKPQTGRVKTKNQVLFSDFFFFTQEKAFTHLQKEGRGWADNHESWTKWVFLSQGWWIFSNKVGDPSKLKAEAEMSIRAYSRLSRAKTCLCIVSKELTHGGPFLCVSHDVWLNSET